MSTLATTDNIIEAVRSFIRELSFILPAACNHIAKNTPTIPVNSISTPLPPYIPVKKSPTNTVHISFNHHGY